MLNFILKTEHYIFHRALPGACYHCHYITFMYVDKIIKYVIMKLCIKFMLGKFTSPIFFLKKISAEFQSLGRNQIFF
jgi:hypothetical protein